MKRILFLYIFIYSFSFVFGQLDTQFFCPPLNDFSNQPNQLVISTPSATANVVVRSPNNTALPPTNYTVTAGTPLIINFTTVIPAFNAVIGNIQNNLRNTVLNDAGLIIISDEPIAAYLKPNAGNNQEIIPLKGLTGLGTTFRVGSQTLPREPGCGNDLEENSHFISVMASEDNTTVTFNNPNPGGFEGVSNPVSFTLDEGETVMVQTPIGALSNQITGTLVSSNRPISVTSGGQHIGAFSAGACDAGIDNLVPIEEIGTDYIFARGNGNASSASQDYAVIVAHFNNTEIFVNGVSQGVINAGQFFNYVTPQAPFGSPFYVQTSNPAYVFHVSSRGNNEMGMSLLPRIICTGNRYINFPRQASLVNGVYVIIPTSAIPSFRFNGQNIAFYGVTPTPVPTLPTWSVLNFGDASIVANNIMTADESFHIGLLGNNGTRTGLYGFLSSYTIDIQAFNPFNNLPSSSFVIEDVCITEAFIDTLLVRSCAPPNVIDSFVLSPPNAGVVQIETQIGPENPVYSFLANSGVYSGSASITFFISNDLGHQTQVTTNFFVNDPPQILTGFPTISCLNNSAYILEGEFTGVPPFSATGSGTPGTWVGNNWTSGPISSLDSFFITVTDVNLCSPAFDLQGSAPSCLDANNDSIFCVNGTINNLNLINILNNDSLNSDNVLISEVSLNILNPDTSGFINLSSTGNTELNATALEGSYSIEYEICLNSDPSICDNAFVYVNVSPQIEISVIQNPSDCGESDGSAEISGLIVGNEYELDVNGVQSIFTATSNNFLIDNLADGIYDVFVNNDFNCSSNILNFIIDESNILPSPSGIGCN